MAKKRYINTRFWDDNYISNLDPIEKLLFLYFLTNQRTDICGIYEIPLKSIAMDTGLDKEMVIKVVNRFSADNKIFYIDGWVYVKNFSKHQAVNPKIEAGIQRNLEDIPAEIKAKIEEINIGYDSLSKPIALKLKLKPTLKLKPIGSEDTTPTPAEEMRMFVRSEEKQESIVSYLEDKGVNRELAVKEINKFLSYWTELNKSGTLQRWETEKTFELKRRLATWFGNVKQFSSVNKPKFTSI